MAKFACLVRLSLALAMSTAAMPALAQAEKSADTAATQDDAKPTKAPKFIVATPEAIGEVLRYNALPYTTETVDGNPTLIVDVDGTKTVIEFYGKAPDYDSIQLYTGFSGSKAATHAKMNEWNGQYRYTRAYIDAEGDPILEMDINFAFGGLSERQLEDWLALWEQSISAFRAFVYTGDASSDAAKAFLRQLRKP